LKVIVSLIQINALSQANVFLSLYSILFKKKFKLQDHVLGVERVDAITKEQIKAAEFIVPT